MNLIDRITINSFHNDRIKEFGTGTIGALGWSGVEVQLKRFEILSNIANLNGCSVIDAGCGHSDLFPFLKIKYPGFFYTGIENNSAFLDIAIERYGDDPNAKFMLGDFTGAELPLADYILCCGALSYKNNESDFIKNTITKLFASCRYGLGFNLLSEVKNPGGIIVAYEPQEILAICRQLTPHVELHDGYLPGDFSIFLTRFG